MMILERVSQLTGKTHKMAINIDKDEYDVCYKAWRWNGVLLQDAFDMLTANEREFIKSGITPEEWEADFPEEREVS